ncbi:MAG: hypothetical protein J3Q66DRAFT_362244 [Benniella sp.]|nr:MAG: hypothetical protein J3Q66DRAFT_362244 [Benniella sp.]
MAMRHSLLTADVSPLIPPDDSTILQSQRPATVAVAAAVTSITSELIHASLVAATQSHHYSESTENTCASSDISTSYCTNMNADCTMPPLLSSSSTRRSRTATCVSAPKMSQSSLATLEYSIHISPRRMTRDLATVFPNKDLSNLLVVPTFQKCHHDMVSWDTEIAKEKDDRLEDFVRWSTALHQGLERQGYWSDMTDPASGFPSFSERGRDVYPDVEGCQLLLKYDFQNAGCCKILLHPAWGSKIYPATFFTTAPVEVLLKAVDELESVYPSPS